MLRDAKPLLTIVVLLVALAHPAAHPPAAHAEHEQPPDGLWSPAPGTTPTDTSTYVHLESDTGDYVGVGRTFDYRPRDSVIDVELHGFALHVSVDGFQRWSGSFAGPTVDGAPMGFHDGLTRYPFHDEALGGLSWSGMGNGCSKVFGWFVVDELTTNATGDVTRLHLRFEQHCEREDAPPLRGEIVYDATVPFEPSLNPRAVPDGIWDPDPATISDARTFVHGESEVGLLPGGVSSRTFRTSNAAIGVRAALHNDGVAIDVDGDDSWGVRFSGPAGMGRLQPGYYTDLGSPGLATASHQLHPFPHCSSIASSGFVVDEVEYTPDDELQRLRLRFHRTCEDGRDLLRLLVVWDADAPIEPSVNPGPVPDGLWEPDPGAVPEDAATYVHVDSEPGDHSGRGLRRTYRTDTTSIAVQQFRQDTLSVRVTTADGDLKDHDILFSGPHGDSLTVGHYGELSDIPSTNPHRGRMHYRINGRGCSRYNGWFLVEDIGRAPDGSIERFVIRFERQCSSDDGALRGVIAWDGTVAPEPSPNPVAIPPDFWQPDPSDVPDAETWVLTEAYDGSADRNPTQSVAVGGETAHFDIALVEATLRFTASDVEAGLSRFSATFTPPDDMPLPWPGLYADVAADAATPRVGTLTESDCREPDRGDVVIDDLDVVDGELERVTMRWEVQCPGDPGPSHGKLVAGPDYLESLRPPETFMAEGPPAISAEREASFRYTADDPAATFECYEFFEWVPCAAEHTRTDLSDGWHHSKVRAVDADGNADPTPPHHVWLVDAEVPSVELLSRPPDLTSDTDATFKFRDSEHDSATECRLDAGDWSACYSPLVVDHLADGSHHLEMRAYDSAGNVSASVEDTWTVDTTPPETTITSGRQETSGTTADFAFTGSGAPVASQCRIDRGPWEPCTSPVRYGELSEGLHVFEVRNLDAAGNIDPTQARWEWTVDASLDPADEPPGEDSSGGGGADGDTSGGSGTASGDTSAGGSTDGPSTDETTATTADPFTDDDASIFEADIEAIAAADITRGCNPPTNDRYCPHDLVTRGEMAAFLTRALDLSTAHRDTFRDDDTSIFEADIEAIAAADITRGCNPPTNDRYCPHDLVTRGEMAAFLTRALDLSTAHRDTFRDDDTSIFEADIEAIAAADITRGCNPPTNDRYCPHDLVTRGEMAAFLTRALDL